MQKLFTNQAQLTAVTASFLSTRLLDVSWTNQLSNLHQSTLGKVADHSFSPYDFVCKGVLNVPGCVLPKWYLPFYSYDSDALRHRCELASSKHQSTSSPATTKPTAITVQKKTVWQITNIQASQLRLARFNGKKMQLEGNQADCSVQINWLLGWLI